MKSRTSSCKAAAFKKDLTRFWPVWAGYILCLVIIQLMLSNDDLAYWYAANMGECISVMGLVNAVYALVVAQMLFGDLFNTRMCNGLHSLPLRRQEWFDAHIAAGFLFSLVPTALMTGFSEVIIQLYSVMEKGWQLPLYWFAATNLQYVFFFGLAVFCCMCAGSRLGATIVYGILNSFSLLVYLMVDQLYTPLLFGVVTSSTFFELLCPVMQIANTRCIDATRKETGRMITHAPGVEEREYIGVFEVVAEGWNYIFVLVIIGIVLLLLARLIYKHRHLECAGDLLAVRWLENPFQVVFTVLCAAGLHGLFMVFFGLNTEYIYVLPAIGLLVGWFAGRMFLERTAQVFRLKNFAGFAAVTAAVVLSLFVTHLDPLGIETWIPDPSELKGADLSLRYQSNFTTEDPMEIDDIIRLHEIALEQNVNLHPDYDPYFYNDRTNDPNAARIELTYMTESGLNIRRQYHVLAEGEGADLIRKYCSRLDVVVSDPDIKDLDDLRHEIKDADRVDVHGRTIPERFVTEEFLLTLADAIAADCEAGNMVQLGSFHSGIIMETGNPDDPLRMLQLDINKRMDDGRYVYVYLNVYADCENILSVLEPTGVLDTIKAEYENAYG